MANLNFLNLSKNRKRKLKTSLLILPLALMLVWLGFKLDLGETNLLDGFAREIVVGQTKTSVNFGKNWLDKNFNWDSLDKNIFQVPERLNPRGLNLVFVSDEFENFEEFKNTAAGIAQGLRTVEPWKSYQDFNFFTVFNQDNSICQAKDELGFAPTLKCSKKLIGLIQKLPLVKVKIIVVSRENFVSWANVTRFENSFVFYSLSKEKENDSFNKKIFWHEFAHGFGLRDETRSIIGMAGSAPARPEGPNCAPSLDLAKKWWGDLIKRQSQNLFFDHSANDVGFYFGCAGNEAYIRPTQQSLMNIQDFPGAENYGPVSERYLKKMLDYCFSKKLYKISDDPKFFEQYPEFKECLQ